jgi:hypothetical protein
MAAENKQKSSAMTIHFSYAGAKEKVMFEVTVAPNATCTEVLVQLLQAIREDMRVKSADFYPDKFQAAFRTSLGMAPIEYLHIKSQAHSSINSLTPSIAEKLFKDGETCDFSTRLPLPTVPAKKVVEPEDPTQSLDQVNLRQQIINAAQSFPATALSETDPNKAAPTQAAAMIAGSLDQYYEAYGCSKGLIEEFRAAEDIVDQYISITNLTAANADIALTQHLPPKNSSPATPPFLPTAPSVIPEPIADPVDTKPAVSFSTTSSSSSGTVGHVSDKIKKLSAAFTATTTDQSAKKELGTATPTKSIPTGTVKLTSMAISPALNRTLFMPPPLPGTLSQVEAPTTSSNIKAPAKK